MLRGYLLRQTTSIIIIIVLLLVSVGYLTWRDTHGPAARRRQARDLMDRAYALCDPATSQDPDRMAAIARTRHAIGRLHLYQSEKFSLLTAFDNQLNLRGCGEEANYVREQQAQRGIKHSSQSSRSP
jgi:hypothetical protein